MNGRRSANIEDRRVVAYVVLAPEGKTGGRVIDAIHTTREAAEERMAELPTAWLEEHPLLGVATTFDRPPASPAPAADGGWRGMLLRWVRARWSGLGLSLLLLTGPLSGCALVGAMPDPPALGASACAEYRAEVKYVRALEDTYRSRGGWNRGALYVAGGILIAGLSFVTAGAATGIALGTIALTGIATGAAGGLVGMVDNSTLAAVYTVAANSVTRTLVTADGHLALDAATGHRYRDQAGCAAALGVLRAGVVEARVLLETARADSAVAALIRATAQRQDISRALRGQPE